MAGGACRCGRMVPFTVRRHALRPAFRTTIAAPSLSISSLARRPGGFRPRSFRCNGAVTRRNRRRGVKESSHEEIVVGDAVGVGADGRAAARGQDPCLLLGGQPGEFRTERQHDRHLLRCRHADLRHHRPVRARGHQGPAGACGEMGDFAGRADLHLPPAQERQVAVQQELQADARLQRRRRAVHDRAAVEGGQPLLQGDELEPLLLQRHGHAEAAQVGREGRRLHGQDHAEPARGAVPRRPRHAVCRRAVEGIRRCDAEGRHAREARSGPDRHRAVLPRAVPEGRDHPLQGLPRLLGRQGEDRRPRLRDHAGCLGALPISRR